LARALVVLPWAVPVSLATLAWQWMFDSLYSVINWTLAAVGLIGADTHLQWLGQQDLAMIAVTVVHAWRLFPFGVVIFIAGFTSVPKDVLDAATIDGAGFWRRNYQIILPIIAPVVMIALIFGTVFTFTDLSVVYLLTKGGPMNGTQVLGSLAFQVGIISGDVAHGAVICLFLFPFLLIAVVAFLRALRRREI
jgi:multiple sugar transport system permease protein